MIGLPWKTNQRQGRVFVDWPKKNIRSQKLVKVSVTLPKHYNKKRRMLRRSNANNKHMTPCFSYFANCRILATWRRDLAFPFLVCYLPRNEKRINNWIANCPEAVSIALEIETCPQEWKWHIFPEKAVNPRQSRGLASTVMQANTSLLRSTGGLLLRFLLLWCLPSLIPSELGRKTALGYECVWGLLPSLVCLKLSQEVHS